MSKRTSLQRKSKKKTVIRALTLSKPQRDGYHLLSREPQVVLVRLRTGHNKLNILISWQSHQPAPVVKKTKPQSTLYKDAAFIVVKKTKPQSTLYKDAAFIVVKKTKPQSTLYKDAAFIVAKKTKPQSTLYKDAAFIVVKKTKPQSTLYKDAAVHCGQEEETTEHIIQRCRFHCGQKDETTEHIIQRYRCRFHKAMKETVWPVSTSLTTKLHDCKQELEQMTSSIPQAALVE